MTPLAMQIAQALRKPGLLKKKPGGVWLPKRIISSAQFDISAVFKEATDLQERFIKQGDPENLLFLPAPITWIEWGGKNRYGVLLESCESGIKQTDVCLDREGLHFQEAHLFLGSFGALSSFGNKAYAYRTGVIRELMSHRPVAAALAMINTPRIIGRRIHMPHAGLQKELARQKGLVGKFPLQAWTEIKLEVTPPADETGKIAKNTILTGERALHFVRAHLRIRNGMLVRVSAHWRGNPAMGIKQTRFSVQPPKNGIWPTELRPQLSGQPT